MNQLIREDPDAGKDWRQEEKGMTEDEMFGWHHWFNGQEFEQAPGEGEGQGKPVVLQSMRSQSVGHDWAAEKQQNAFYKIDNMISPNFNICFTLILFFNITENYFDDKLFFLFKMTFPGCIKIAWYED